MEHNHEQIKNTFDTEPYIGRTIDIVHIDSLQRIVDGKKMAEPHMIRDARQKLEWIKTLEANGIHVRHIEDPNNFERPQKLEGKLILGGAFDGECLQDYKKTCEAVGVDFEIDGKLTLRID